jgi:hypothetical protein
MGKLFTNLVRNKNYMELYIDGELIVTIKVSEQNKGSRATIDFEAPDKVKFKLKKEHSDIKDLIDDSYFNKEVFNK